MDKFITYVGLDVHKDTFVIAPAGSSKRGEVRGYGKIPNTPAAVKTAAAKLARGGSELRFCYEAGPCGYGIQRLRHASGAVPTAVSIIDEKAIINSRLLPISYQYIASIRKFQFWRWDESHAGACFQMDGLGQRALLYRAGAKGNWTPNP
jgi:hypothetical protein